MTEPGRQPARKGAGRKLYTLDLTNTHTISSDGSIDHHRSRSRPWLAQRAPFCGAAFLSAARGSSSFWPLAGPVVRPETNKQTEASVPSPSRRRSPAARPGAPKYLAARPLTSDVASTRAVSLKPPAGGPLYKSPRRPFAPAQSKRTRPRSLAPAASKANHHRHFTPVLSPRILARTALLSPEFRSVSGAEEPGKIGKLAGRSTPQPQL